MYDNPSSMFDLCIDTLCRTLSSTLTAQPVSRIETDFTVKSSLFFPGHISEQILKKLSEWKVLNDQLMTFFQPETTQLRKVHIADSQLTRNGLKILKRHKIVDLTVTGLKYLTVNDIVGCLSEWSMCNLRSLNVSSDKFHDESKLCVIISLSKLKNVVSLNVSNTDFNSHGLEIIASDLPNLEHLDISESDVNEVTPLKHCKQRIKSLVMYNVKFKEPDHVVPVLGQLTNLRFLDISDDMYIPNGQALVNMYPNHFNIVQLLSDQTSLPRIVSLDISGKEAVTEDCLRNFLRQRSTISFIGLALTEACHYSFFSDDQAPNYITNLTVTGDANEAQVLECLKRYASRPSYVHKALFSLFGLTSSLVQCREDIILLVTTVMKCHPMKLGVQLASTACLYNLTKGPLTHKLHPQLLSEVVLLTLDAMENFSKHGQLQKNCLLTLCTERILQEIKFNRYRCASLVMDCLCSFEDQSMIRMAVAICSILAAKITTEETSILGSNQRNMHKLLSLIQQRMSPSLVDMTLKFTLSALWNLTDESPPTCTAFLMEQGLELSLSLIQNIQEMADAERTPIETKILGLLNNISEVPHLFHHLLREDFVMVICRLLDSSFLEVSYFAAGIIAYLACNQDVVWTLSNITREELLLKLNNQVLSWKQPETEMVAYRSFKPFHRLLINHETQPCQLWALWAIHHVCIRNPQKYCSILHNESGEDMLRNILHHSNTSCDVSSVAKSLLQLVAENIPE